MEASGESGRKDPVTGRIHSFESAGMVDGPGTRFVVFFQGCPCRCLYCHNPDTWDPKQGSSVSAKEIAEKALSYIEWIKASGGGITLSGGEPLMQPLFALDIINRCTENGIHTAIDTSGLIPLTEPVKKAIEAANLILLDIKSVDPQIHQSLTGRPISYLHDVINFINDINKPIWVRHVILPEMTDLEGIDGTGREKLKQLKELLLTIPSLEHFDLLPFHKMGEEKWENVATPYTLKERRTPSVEEMSEIKEIFKDLNAIMD